VAGGPRPSPGAVADAASLSPFENRKLAKHPDLIARLVADLTADARW
jgi:hypothetical protein